MIAMKERIIQAIPSGLVQTTLEYLHQVPGWYLKSTNIFDRDWDVLIILDGCRYDLYRDVVGDGEYIYSLGSASAEWMRNTFTDEYEAVIKNTAYVSGNPHTNNLDEQEFGLLDHVWQYSWDSDRGTIHPEPVTNRGVSIARSQDFERVIIHYMQPHYPFIGDDIPIGRISDPPGSKGGGSGQSVWNLVMTGEVDKEVALEGYRQNLMFVLKWVEIVTNNVDGRVVVTADHGNALGEWGYWGHRDYLPFRSLRKVPWHERECSDEGTYEPDPIDTQDNRISVEDRLRDLGYI